MCQFCIILQILLPCMTKSFAPIRNKISNFHFWMFDGNKNNCSLTWLHPFRPLPNRILSFQSASPDFIKYTRIEVTGGCWRLRNLLIALYADQIVRYFVPTRCRPIVVITIASRQCYDVRRRQFIIQTFPARSSSTSPIRQFDWFNTP